MITLEEQEVLRAAIDGLHAKIATYKARLEELQNGKGASVPRARLGETAVPEAPAKSRRQISKAGRARMAAAQKRRWKAYYQAERAKKQTAQKKTPR